MSRMVISANLELRLLHEPDAEELFRLTDANRDHLRQWLPWLDATRTVADTRSFILSAMRRFSETRAFAAGIRLDGRMVGVIGHNRIDWETRTAFLGYWLARDCQGKGIMTACCRAVIDHAFSELNLDRVVITCATENLRSRAIPEHLGCRCERVEAQAEWLYDHFVDHAIYVLESRKGQSEPVADSQ